MDVRFVSPDLHRLDQMKAEAICLPLPQDERPLRGILGLIDWRLCARISKLIEGGRISGQISELLLMPARPKLSFDKLFLYGVGDKNVEPNEFDRAVNGLLRALAKARIRSAAIALPRGDTLPPDATMERFLALRSAISGFDDLSLIEEPARQREMKPVVDSHRRRRRADLA